MAAENLWNRTQFQLVYAVGIDKTNFIIIIIIIIIIITIIFIISIIIIIISIIITTTIIIFQVLSEKYAYLC